MPVPLLNLQIPSSDIRVEIDAVLKTLLDKANYIGGEEVTRFAEEFSTYCGGGHCVPVANGTDALVLALKGLGVGAGDEVITVPFTFIASAESITWAGAQVKFVDVDAKTYTMDVHALTKAVGPKTKGVMPVHLFGQTADMDPILDLAKTKKLIVVEDAAQAHGAEYKGRRAGSMGDAACFSFYPTKNLGGFGDGGAVIAKDKAAADRIAQLANHGRTETYFHAVEGVNSRLDSFQAGILRILLRRVEQWNTRRREVADRYREALSKQPHVTAPFVAPYAKHVYHLFCVESDHRDALAVHLKAKGIGNGIYYPVPLHLQPAYARLGHKKGDFPVSERLSSRILALPMYPHLTDAQVKEVCDALVAFRPA